MQSRSLLKSITLVLLILYSTLLFAITTPEKYFGFVPGSDRNLIDYEQLIGYLKKVDSESEMVKMIRIGHTPMGKTMYLLFISSPENINNLEQLRFINRELALNPELDEKTLKKYTVEGKVFVLATLSMHSNEVGPSQALPLIVYKLTTSQNPEIKNMLNNVVYMAVPCHNPDGMDMVVKHYRRYKGTKYEGTPLPGIYHKYVGHDNNRDFIMLTQEDTKAIAKIYNQDWFPQVMVEKHQMGSRGVRYFVPPAHDPIAENIDAELWNWTTIFGSHMLRDMTNKNLAGVAQNYLFDDYWPGSTETCLWKGVIAMLTESASAKLATPVYVEPNELGVSGKGLSEYKKSIKMPLIWRGGWWRLEDIVKYEIESTLAILRTASKYKKDILQFRNLLCKREIARGKTEPPYYYIFPYNQKDKTELVNLVNLMREHGIKVYQLTEDREINSIVFKKGDIAIPLSQPFRAFIKEVLEVQKYPVRHYTPGGKIIKPYDITSWSLPLHMGLKVYEINEKVNIKEKYLTEIKKEYTIKYNIPEEFSAVLLPARSNGSYKIVFEALKEGLNVTRVMKKSCIEDITAENGDFLVIIKKPEDSKTIKNILTRNTAEPVFIKSTKLPENLKKISPPRILLVETYFHDMDAGWTRFLFDQYSIPYRVVRPHELKNSKLFNGYHIIIFPDQEKSILMEGKYKYSDGRKSLPSYPPKYTKGMEKEGLNNLLKFLSKGGRIITWASSTSLFEGILKIEDKKSSEEFQLPIRNIASNLKKKGLYCPGCLVRINLESNHPLTFGVGSEIGVYYRGDAVFNTTIPMFTSIDRRVIGSFPEEKILLSGYIEGEKLLSNRPALVWVKKDKGEIIFFAFDPIFRCMVPSNYKLLFNAILM